MLNGRLNLCNHQAHELFNRHDLELENQYDRVGESLDFSWRATNKKFFLQREQKRER